MEENKIIIYTTEDGSVKFDVPFDGDTVWLSANQMAELFERDEKTIRKHINNVFLENEVQELNNTQNLRVVGVKQSVSFYSLDVIISVGYRVKSARGVEFRRWATSVLKDYILKGVAVNKNRLDQLGEVIKIMKRIESSLEAKQVLSVIEKYNSALDLLDDYDHQIIKRPQGRISVYRLTYDECKKIIDSMKFGDASELFGKEKDDSFSGSIGNIYQTFDGDEKLIQDFTLVALTIMIAESKPEEKEAMVSVVMNCICKIGN